MNDPLPEEVLKRVELDYRKFMEDTSLHPMIKATLKEGFVHFIFRAVPGFWNYDLDIPEINQVLSVQKIAVFSIKDRNHNVGFFYHRMANGMTAYLYKLVYRFNRELQQWWDYFKVYQVLSERDETLVFKGDRSQFMNWLKELGEDLQK